MSNNFMILLKYYYKSDRKVGEKTHSGDDSNSNLGTGIYNMIRLYPILLIQLNVVLIFQILQNNNKKPLCPHISALKSSPRAALVLKTSSEYIYYSSFI